MIKSFNIKDYRQFENVEFNNFSNINLFIGENDTGKTTILKLLYSITSIYANNDMHTNIITISKELNNKIEYYDSNKNNDFLEKLKKVELNQKIVNLNNKLKGLNLKSDLIFSITLQNIEYNLPDEDKNFFKYDYKSLFIPAKEILSIMGAINYLKLQNIKSGFDDSYTDIISEIYAPKNKTKNTLDNILRNYRVYDGELEYKKTTKEIFYKKSNGDSYHIEHTAEGIKKLGIFDILYKTGNIQKNSVIYIDEPENSLHPTMLREFMRFLVALSKENIQIFMASHSSFVLNQLSNIAQKEDYPINVYKFIKENNKTIVYGPFDLSKDFPENSITNESYNMFVESKSE